jgi:hypothetical protein
MLVTIDRVLAIFTDPAFQLRIRPSQNLDGLAILLPSTHS